jgi:hypothetical protein
MHVINIIAFCAIEFSNFMISCAMNSTLLLVALQISCGCNSFYRIHGQVDVILCIASNLMLMQYIQLHPSYP